jgi:hypothetical protein
MSSAKQPNNSRDVCNLTMKLFKSTGVEFCRSMHPVSLNMNNIKAQVWKPLMMFVSYAVNLLLV